MSLGSSRFITGRPAIAICALQIVRQRKRKKKAREYPLPVLGAAKPYSATIASVGHEATHAPQSVHLSGSIVCCPFVSEIASTGQSLTHAPQFTQASLIL
jgi:hypothetical protein